MSYVIAVLLGAQNKQIATRSTELVRRTSKLYFILGFDDYNFTNYTIMSYSAKQRWVQSKQSPSIFHASLLNFFPPPVFYKQTTPMTNLPCNGLY